MRYFHLARRTVLAAASSLEWLDQATPHSPAWPVAGAPARRRVALAALVRTLGAASLLSVI
jgi:hypothetical protein